MKSIGKKPPQSIIFPKRVGGGGGGGGWAINGEIQLLAHLKAIPME